MKVVCHKNRYTPIKNSPQVVAAAAQIAAVQTVVNFQSAAATSQSALLTAALKTYIPLQIVEVEPIVHCLACGAATKIVDRNRGGESALCVACLYTMNVMDWIFCGPLDEIFPEVNTREHSDDGIIWKVSTGANVWPIYTKRDASQQNIFYVPKVGFILDRDYFCHDSFLYKDTVPSITTYKGGYGLRRGEELYMYQFHKVIHDGTGWVIGFILDGKHLLAHDVEMTDDEHT